VAYFDGYQTLLKYNVAIVCKVQQLQ